VLGRITKEKNQMRIQFLTATALIALAITPALAADPMVGGAAMYPGKNIVENAVNSKDARRCGQGWRPGRHTRGQRAFHRICSDQ
jgi:hypothetical protein